MLEHKSTLATVILAAGQAKRFGSAKQLAQFNGATLIANAIKLANAVTPEDSWLVLGAHSEDILRESNLGSVQTLLNPDWQSGMSASIRQTVQKLGACYDGILFLSVDQVLITHADLERLISLWKDHPEQLACASFDDRISIPAVFPSWVYPELVQLEGDSGGKKILQKYNDKLIAVEMPSAAFDVDTQADLVRLRQDS